MYSLFMLIQLPTVLRALYTLNKLYVHLLRIWLTDEMRYYAYSYVRTDEFAEVVHILPHLIMCWPPRVNQNFIVLFIQSDSHAEYMTSRILCLYIVLCVHRYATHTMHA